jgi:TRAP-type C4-dicarboxylate transport system permease large subunit
MKKILLILTLIAGWQLSQAQEKFYVIPESQAKAWKQYHITWYFGIDPVHLGIIFLANLELGFLTPPVGMNLFLASYRFHKPMPEVYRSVVPMVAVRFAAVLLITYFPPLTTALPHWFGG